eukprot:m.41389 g.41389  ORF g.41389 m.41389 type:complete len:84 (-) comp16856_c2_seq1:354-605(-)
MDDDEGDVCQFFNETELHDMSKPELIQTVLQLQTVVRERSHLSCKALSSQSNAASSVHLKSFYEITELQKQGQQQQQRRQRCD